MLGFAPISFSPLGEALAFYSLIYPAFNCYPGSAATPSQKAEAYVDGAGDHHVFWPAQKKRFTLKHVLTVADMATLQALWAAAKLVSVAFTWYEDGVVYNVMFLEQPKREGLAGTTEVRNVTVELGEV